MVIKNFETIKKNDYFMTLISQMTNEQLLNKPTMMNVFAQSGVKPKEFHLYMDFVEWMASSEINRLIVEPSKDSIETEGILPDLTTSQEEVAVSLSSPSVADLVWWTMEEVLEQFNQTLQTCKRITADDIYALMQKTKSNPSLLNKLFDLARQSGKLYEKEFVPKTTKKTNKLQTKQAVPDVMSKMSKQANEFDKMTDHRKHFREYHEYVKNGEMEKAREKEEYILCRNQGLVYHVYNRFKVPNKQFEPEDIIQNGQVGLLEAIRKYNPDKGEFSTYAIRAIRTHIIKFIQSNVSTIKASNNVITTHYRIRQVKEYLLNQYGQEPTDEEIAIEYKIRYNKPMTSVKVKQIMDSVKMVQSYDTLAFHGSDDDETSLKDIIPDSSSLSPSEEYEQKELSYLIEKTLDTLTHRESEIIQMYYGLSPDRRKWTLEEISLRHGVTKERIRQVLNTAIDKLRHPGRNRELASIMYPDEFI